MKPKSADALLSLLAMLKSLHTQYYQAHWTTSGPLFYEHHLLFQRLYEAEPSQFDDLAERLVGANGSKSIPLAELSSRVNSCLARWSKESDLINRSLVAENDLQTGIKDAYDLLKKNGDLSLGTDDYLMALSDAHDTHEYLLRQSKPTS